MLGQVVHGVFTLVLPVPFAVYLFLTPLAIPLNSRRVGVAFMELMFRFNFLAFTAAVRGVVCHS